MPKPLKGTLFVTFENLGFVSGQVRFRGKGGGEYPFHYLEMIDYVFGKEENTIEVCFTVDMILVRHIFGLDLWKIYLHSLI
jgi:hypothetical protein